MFTDVLDMEQCFGLHERQPWQVVVSVSQAGEWHRSKLLQRTRLSRRDSALGEITTLKPFSLMMATLAAIADDDVERVAMNAGAMCVSVARQRGRRQDNVSVVERCGAL
jgi:hypothetical protein